MLFQNKRLIGIAFAVGLILLIPLISMQLTQEVNWTAFDFLVAGCLLLGTGLVIELVFRKVRKTQSRIALCLLVLTLLFIIWAELAVGIFDSPVAGR